ncbi:unnamed protein product [Linum trigynum]|uniref:Uncharacterized protein n=1 Tax=Linum trigynum TaxID=586398 RepID=A0AAV2DXJ1_9ROSI
MLEGIKPMRRLDNNQQVNEEDLAWCHEVVAVSRAGSHQAVEGEIKTSSWFMETKARTSTQSSHDKATRLNTNPTGIEAIKYPPAPRWDKDPKAMVTN